jgi:hypothetical protein
MRVCHSLLYCTLMRAQVCACKYAHAARHWLCTHVPACFACASMFVTVCQWCMLVCGQVCLKVCACSAKYLCMRMRACTCAWVCVRQCVAGVCKHLCTRTHMLQGFMRVSKDVLMVYARTRAKLPASTRMQNGALFAHACARMLRVYMCESEDVLRVCARTRTSLPASMRMQHGVRFAGACARVARVRVCFEQECVEGVCAYAHDVACKYAHAKLFSLCSRVHPMLRVYMYVSKNVVWGCARTRAMLPASMRMRIGILLLACAPHVARVHVCEQECGLGCARASMSVLAGGHVGLNASPLHKLALVVSQNFTCRWLCCCLCRFAGVPFLLPSSFCC